ncbi:MAG TPA: putative peptidoglycan glycosyltransferase FtsW [Chlamydiales bacterium]|nr:putative peptidoglycan glycosyltransferase FtsW [Chlamydiales bacterium]
MKKKRVSLNLAIDSESDEPISRGQFYSLKRKIPFGAEQKKRKAPVAIRKMFSYSKEEFFNRISLLLIIPVAILLTFGLLMIFNTTAAQIIDKSLEVDTHTALFKQLLFGGIGVLLGSIAYALGYENLLRLSRPALIFATLLLALLFVPKVGQTINGATRWMNVFGFSFQPSEWVKLLIPPTYLHWALKQKEIRFVPFLKILGALSIPIILIFLEPDNGTTAIILFVLFILFFLTSVPLLYWAVPLALFVGSAGAVAYQMPYVQGRIQVYLHPELDLKGKGHQPYQAKIAAGAGGLWGRGLGESLQKLNYLPEARNDYIAAIFAEEMGFIGVLGLIFLYMIFAFGGVCVANRAKDLSGCILAAAFTFLIAIQAFLNLGIVSGLLPSKGMTLPFFSQGGTSLIVNLVLLFLLLDISRKSNGALQDGL